MDNTTLENEGKAKQLYCEIELKVEGTEFLAKVLGIKSQLEMLLFQSKTPYQNVLKNKYKLLMEWNETGVFPVNLPVTEKSTKIPVDKDLARNQPLLRKEIELVAKLEEEARAKLSLEGIDLLVQRLTVSTGQQVQSTLQTPSPQSQPGLHTPPPTTAEKQGNVRVRADGTRTIRGEFIPDVDRKIERMRSFLKRKGVDSSTITGVLKAGAFTLENRGWWKCKDEKCKSGCKQDIPSHPPSQIIRFTQNGERFGLKVPEAYKITF